MAQATDLIYGMFHDESWYCESDTYEERGVGATYHQARSAFIIANNLDWTEFAKEDVDDMDKVMRYAVSKFDALTELSAEARNTAFLMWFEATFCK